MSFRVFPPGEDPGPSFVELLRVAPAPGHWAPASAPTAAPANRSGLEVAHGTTICAVRYVDGVVMAGDRRVTSGHSIAYRSFEKVFPADRYSAVAIAGAAGPAVEMVRLFQTQLEHYEKVEGTALSLEGKANQLSQMVRSNLPMAMEGLAVVPLFAGYDKRRQVGRIFTYDVTGGRYEETDFHATGSGGGDAKNTIKLGYRDGMTREQGVELLVKALFEAADEDSATGGPDLVRGIYPVVATVDATGFSLVSEEEVAERFRAVIASRTAVESAEPPVKKAAAVKATKSRGGKTSS